VTPKQQLFVREYLVDLNATQAAIRAGYSERTAGQMGFDLLKNPQVAAAIQSGMDKRAAKVEITAERVLQEIARLAFFDPSKLYDEHGRPKPVHELDEDTRRAIAGVEIDEVGGGDKPLVVTRKVKLADKGANLERLGRHLKLFTEKVEISGAVVSVKDFTGKPDA
jgi:phage terminase small subunit